MIEAIRVAAQAVTQYLPWTKKESVASVLSEFYTTADKLDAIADREDKAAADKRKAADVLWYEAADCTAERNRALRSAKFLRSIGDDV